MGMNKVTQYLTAWIASFAILLALLAPSMSYAMTAAQGPGISGAEICSVSAAKPTDIADSLHVKPFFPADKATHSGHCPFCSTHAGSFGLPPSAAFAFPVTSGSDIVPLLFYQSPRPLFIWAAAQSRAPPFAS
jgi:hypothetical protein